VTTLSSLCDIIDCEHRTAPTSESGYPLIRTPDVGVGRLDVESAQRVDEATYRSWTKRAVPRAGDLILAREAPVGNVGIVLPGVHPVLGQRTVLIRTRSDLLDPYYLNYLLSGPAIRGWMQGVSTGATVPHLNVADIRSMELPALPPVQTQHKIAAVLSAYDDLIANNNRRIKLLDELAQRTFHEWFVDFRFPGGERVPLVDSDLGSIPQGWSVQRMDEVADVIDCLHSKKPEAIEDGPGVLLQLFNIGSGGSVDLSQIYRISAFDYAQWTSRIELSQGDCVVTNVGRIAAVAQIPPGLRAAPGRNMTAIRPRTIPPTYLLQYLLSEHMDHEVRRKKDAGSIMDALNVKGIVRLAVPVPGAELANQFEQLARPVRRQMEVLIARQQNLHTTRDLLLPQLISGAIDVTDLDIAMLATAA
jgi:type I restriction enzyme, S subunit